jgi:hypothetical protein
VLNVLAIETRTLRAIGRPIPVLTLTDEEHDMLERWTRRPTTARASAQRVSGPARRGSPCTRRGCREYVLDTLLAVGPHRVGYDLDLRQYGDGHWRASFYVTGLAHSILGGSAWEPTVWRAVQRTGWDALKHAERNL